MYLYINITSYIIVNLYMFVLLIVCYVLVLFLRGKLFYVWHKLCDNMTSQRKTILYYIFFAICIDFCYSVDVPWQHLIQFILFFLNTIVLHSKFLKSYNSLVFRIRVFLF